MIRAAEAAVGRIRKLTVRERRAIAPAFVERIVLLEPVAMLEVPGNPLAWSVIFWMWSYGEM